MEIENLFVKYTKNTALVFVFNTYAQDKLPHMITLSYSNDENFQTALTTYPNKNNSATNVGLTEQFSLLELLFQE